MQEKLYVLFLVFIIVFSGGTVCRAQNSGKPVTPPPAAQHKRPIVKSWLGNVTGNTDLSAEKAGDLLNLPLKITDDKNVIYVISSYQFAYKRIGVTEEEATGKTMAQSDVVAARFTTTPLPPVWQKNILEGLKKGEVLHFFDIIVFDKQGRLFFAPELKITIL